jgi:hypothetical protein
MSGLRLTLPLAFTDTSLAILRDDPILAAGSLALYELGHPLTNITGVPANGALIPNIAVKEAQALIPAATAASLSANFKSLIADATKIKIERSGKGGLHGILSKTVHSGSNFVGMYGRADIAQYIRDHLNNEFYFSYWGLETRSPGTGPGAFTGLSFANAINGTNLHYVISHDSNNYPNSAKKTGGVREVNGTALGGPFADSSGSLTVANGGTATTYPAKIPAKLRLTVGVKGTDSVLDKTGAQVEATNWFKIFSAGAASELFTHNASTGVSSNIHYRTYIEDLTVSGRSFATVDALDKAEYTKHVLTAGGRYYNDTYTAPDTFSA